jgi:hypothetical protein
MASPLGHGKSFIPKGYLFTSTMIVDALNQSVWQLLISFLCWSPMNVYQNDLNEFSAEK